MTKNFLDSDVDYWYISKALKDLYFSDSSVNILLDFERVLNQIDLYAFKNWDIGELVDGPRVNRYSVCCTFMWLADKMPDPRGARRLIPFDCAVKYKKSKLKIPVKPKDYSDFRPGTRKPKIVEKDIWLVQITMPKSLISDVEMASEELEGLEIDIDEVVAGYEQDLQKEENKAE